MNRGTILLRVDGSAKQGMGRIARCLALANALQRRRYQMTFVSQIDNNTWPDRIRRFRHAVSKTPFAAGTEEDRQEFLTEIQRRNPVVVVTDSPAIDEEYLALLSNRVPLVITLDDEATTCFPSDLILNPTIGHALEEYKLYPGAQLLAGNKYAMIRSEFRRARNVRATEPGGPIRVMISLGGGDVVDDTIAYAKGLLKQKRIEKIEAVIGTTTKGREKLDTLAAESEDRLSVISDARDMGIRMTKSHLLITGGGNTALEAACVGIPMLIVTRQAYHELNANRLAEIGVAQYLGSHDKVKGDEVGRVAEDVLSDNFERKAMSRSGRMLIDGRGADRIVTATEILLRRNRSRKAMAA
jgi:spore coat polysaccharide biosynthesis predicted glycosyltransferase SpsG